VGKMERIDELLTYWAKKDSLHHLYKILFYKKRLGEVFPEEIWKDPIPYFSKEKVEEK
jgi:hypothetical protein